MSDSALLREQLEMVLEATERIPPRFADIASPDDFTDSVEGRNRLDAICMVPIGIGEAFKDIDRSTEGRLLALYPQVDWSGLKGVRDVIAHRYFDIDADQVFAICRDDIPPLIQTLTQDDRRSVAR